MHPSRSSKPLTAVLSIRCTYVEHLECPHDRSRVNRAYLTMVAIGADGRPARVPALVPETSAERADFEAGKERRAQRRREKKD